MEAQTDPVLQAMLDARAQLDAGGDERQGAGTGTRCISFRVGDELYAVELAAVREVIVPPAAVPVPGAGREVVGVINLRGNVVTVLNSRAMLGLPGAPTGPSARVLVLDEGGESVGALVDAVDDIIFVETSALQSPAQSRRADISRLKVQGAIGVGAQIAFLVGPEALVGAALE